MESLRWARTVALWAIAVIVIGTTAASLTESYKALVDWAEHHMIGGDFAYIFPVLLDTFILGGELLLFVGVYDKWTRKDRRFAWSMVLIGLAASIAANVGHDGPLATIQDRLTAAAPPIAAWMILAGAIGAFKRINGVTSEDSELVPMDDGLDLGRLVREFAADIKDGNVPGLGKIRSVMGGGHRKTRQRQQHIRELVKHP